MSRVPLFDHVCQGEIRHQLMSIVGRSRSKAHEGVLVHAECQVENKRLGRASGAIGVAFGITSGSSLAWTSTLSQLVQIPTFVGRPIHIGSGAVCSSGAPWNLKQSGG